MKFVQTFSKRLQLAAVAVSIAAVLTPLHAQMSAGSGAMAKPANAASSGMDHSKMPMGPGGDMKSKMDNMQSQMMAMKSTGNADVDFAMMMRVHHQGAITMAEAQLKDGKDPQMKKMAKNIIAAQKKEIAVFDKFLASKGQPAMK
ncbi:MAG: DUF305 domain-containing protein [Rhodocyclaceae bacterium]|nr:DUF305 domain-containing protein [Rhodocyclaceae bacterium]